MAQTVINVGTNANDGTGDDLRTAMVYINNNFTELYAASPITSTISIEGNKIFATSSNADLVLEASGTGAIVLPAITINDNNITGTRSNEDLTISASGTGNIVLGAITINGTTISSADSSAINFAESNVTLGSINISGNVITSTDSTTISFGGETLSGVANPTQSSDVATKDYVDNSANVFGNLEIVGNTIKNVVTNNDLTIQTAGTGVIVLDDAYTNTQSNTVTHTGSSLQQPLDEFVAATYRGGKYLISMSDSTNSRYETAEVWITHNGTTPFIQSTGVSTSGTSMATFTADISNSNVRLLIVPQSSDSVTYKFTRTLIAV